MRVRVLFADAEGFGIWAALLANVIWLGQAGVLAYGLGGLLTGPDEVQPVLLVAVFLVLAVLRVAAGAWSNRVLSQAAEARIGALRAEIITTEMHAAAPSGIGGAGALAALAAEKAEALRPYLMRYRPARLRAAVVPVIIFAVAAWHSWAVAWVLLMAGPLIPVFMALVGWAARRASEDQMSEIGALSDLLVDRLAALSDMRLIGAGGPLIDGFEAASDAVRQRTMAVLKIAFLSSTVLELFAALGVAMVAVWVGFSLLGELGWGSWGRDLSVQTGLLLLLLAPEFFQPLRDLAAAWHDKAAADAVEAECATWRDEDRPVRSLEVTEPLVWTRGLSLSGIKAGGIRYPDLSIAPGERLAIMGPSGAGKTTLLHLLAGLRAPDEGRILVGDTALNAANLPGWRRHLGWMPQAPHFLDASLRHNIGFGATVGQDLLHRARLVPVLDTLPRGGLTRLGERGAGLSGGEARRVTLARALHGRPDILLADEPTADLDAETAGAVVQGLLDYAAAGGTLIVVTHDPALAARMDRVVHIGAEGVE